jgi:large subunit ribosomal protein LP0
MRKAIKGHLETNPAIEKLLPSIKTNIGLIFTNSDLGEIRDLINKNRVPAPARVGTVAPLDVTVPKQQTALEPTMTSFFQALNISTKINKGAIEILNDVALIKKGDKVGASEAALLAKLNIRPFSYGLELISIYDHGAVYSPKVLDLTEDDMAKAFAAGVASIASIGLELGVPTLAAVPYAISKSFRNVLAIAVAEDINIPQLAAAKAASAAAVSAPAAGAAPAAATAAAPAAKKDDTEEEEGDMGMGLFD